MVLYHTRDRRQGFFTVCYKLWVPSFDFVSIEITVCSADTKRTGPNRPEGSSGSSAFQNCQVANVRRPLVRGKFLVSHSGPRSW